MTNADVMKKYPTRFTRLRGGGGNFGIECKDGWAGLIDRMCQELDVLDPQKELTFFSIKEKFGLMRTYLNDGTTGGLAELFNRYETASGAICEECGQPGSMRNKDGYLFTACEAHK